MNEIKFLAVIPARYASTRFPGKPLALIGGKPMIQRVYERVITSVPHVVVATDDERIANAVEAFGGKYVMTSPLHKSGTDRCCEAMHIVGGDYDVVINIQGDEPFIEPIQIDAIKSCFESAETDIATLVNPVSKSSSYSELENPNRPKVVLDDNNFAMYFSRSVIPYLRGVDKDKWPASYQYYFHVGMYAYRCNVLDRISNLPQSSLEKAESLEQLRWLQAGLKIKVGVTECHSIGIDTPADLEAAEMFLKENPFLK